jgi:hypothetical protein
MGHEGMVKTELEDASTPFRVDRCVKEVLERSSSG